MELARSLIHLYTHSFLADSLGDMDMIRTKSRLPSSIGHQNHSPTGPLTRSGVLRVTQNTFREKHKKANAQVWPGNLLIVVRCSMQRVAFRLILTWQRLSVESGVASRVVEILKTKSGRPGPC